MILSNSYKIERKRRKRMIENKRYDVFTELLHTGIGITVEGKEVTGDEVVNKLNEQDKQLQPFIELAKEHDKTLEGLYQFIRSYLNSRNENTYWNPKNYR